MTPGVVATRALLMVLGVIAHLLGVRTGELNTLSAEVSVAASDAYPSVRKEAWNLDLMGNWSGKGGEAPGPSIDPCVWPTVPVIPGGETGIEPGPGGGIDAGVWYATDYGHEVSFAGPPPLTSSGVSEVFERQHPADAPTVTQSKERLPSEWMTSLHANAVRVVQATDPYPQGRSMPPQDPGVRTYTAHRADPNGNTIFDAESGGEASRLPDVPGAVGGQGEYDSDAAAEAAAYQGWRCDPQAHR